MNDEMPESLEQRLTLQLSEAKREAAIRWDWLVAAWQREMDLDATIRALRAELVAVHDLLGQAEGAASPDSASQDPTPGDWTRDFSGDRRRVGG